MTSPREAVAGVLSISVMKAVVSGVEMYERLRREMKLSSQVWSGVVVILVSVDIVIDGCQLWWSGMRLKRIDTKQLGIDQ